MAFTVVAFILLLLAIVMAVLMLIDKGPNMMRDRMICLAVVAVSCLFLLIAWTVYTGCFWSAQKDSQLSGITGDWKPDYALILTALAWLFALAAAVVAFLFKPASAAK